MSASSTPTGPFAPLEGALVVDLTRYLPGIFASRELRRLGARVVRLESPEGDPLRLTAPSWHAWLAQGTESVTCDLPAEASFARALCAGADVVLEGFRPGVAERLGVGPDDLPESVVHCSITGFGADGPHAGRAGHDLNYLGWAGVLEDDPLAHPAVQVADLAAGALVTVTQVLAALVRRGRTGEGARLVVSMTHRAHDFVAYRVGGDPRERLLTGGLACYRAYETADGRHLTVAALEPRFFARLCELAGRPDLTARQFEGDQGPLVRELEALFATATLAEWLVRFGDEDVCVGPVATRAEAHEALGPWPDERPVPALGAQTDAWRRRLGL